MLFEVLPPAVLLCEQANTSLSQEPGSRLGHSQFCKALGAPDPVCEALEVTWSAPCAVHVEVCRGHSPPCMYISKYLCYAGRRVRGVTVVSGSQPMGCRIVSQSQHAGRQQDLQAKSCAMIQRPCLRNHGQSGVSGCALTDGWACTGLR